MGLTPVGHVERPDRFVQRVRIARRGSAVLVERETVASAEHAEITVVGVVLLHDHDDVLDLRNQVAALSFGEVGPLGRQATSRVRGPRPRGLRPPRGGTRVTARAGLEGEEGTRRAG